MWGRLIPLIVIMLVAWVLVLSGTVIIFGVIAPMKLTNMGISPLVEAIIKVAISALLAIIWVLILYALTMFYFRRALRSSPISSAYFPSLVLGM